MLAQLRSPRSQSHRHDRRRGAPRRRASARASQPVPEDAALYVCGCGTAFTAGVSTSVTCPACGDGQAW